MYRLSVYSYSVITALSADDITYKVYACAADCQHPTLPT